MFVRCACGEVDGGGEEGGGSGSGDADDDDDDSSSSSSSSSGGEAGVGRKRAVGDGCAVGRGVQGALEAADEGGSEEEGGASGGDNDFSELFESDADD